MLRTICWLVTLAALAACDGLIADPTGSGSGTPGGGGPGGDDYGGRGEPLCEGLCVGESGMQRLTRAQYAGAVRAVFGDGVEIEEAGLPRDHAAGPFSSNEAVPISERDVEMYASMAGSVAAQATADLDALLPCDPASDGDVACGRALIADLGSRLYRRPLTDDEVAAYEELLSWTLEEGDLAEAAALIVGTMLQSPSFLYRIEPAGPEPTELDGWALASRLSFYLWGEGPDEELWRAATAGELDTPDGLVEQARRMLADPRSDRAIRTFHREWLAIDELDEVGRSDEAFTADLAADMRRETERFAVRVIREEDATLWTLLTSERSMLSPRLADFYGVSHPTGSGFEWATVPGRPGVLSHGAVQAAHASETFTRPVHRGVFLRKNILCDALPAPPANAVAMAEEAAAELPEDMTDRERLEVLTGEEPCASCHRLTNDIGYAFERFDAIGRWRDTDAEGRAIDTSGALSGEGAYATDADGPFTGAPELVTRLADSDTVARCVTTQWLRFALGREESSADAASIEAAHQAFRASGYDIRELMVAVVTTDAFRHRTAPE